MEEIIEPISKELLKAELTEEKRLRMTNKSHNQIYIVTAQDSPNTMKEIGRLREIAFRAAGGGTGKPLDIDEYDVMENPYKQLIVWNPEAEEILGGYRYILGTDVRFDEDGAPILATAHMFNFSEKFLKEYLPTTISVHPCRKQGPVRFRQPLGRSGGTDGSDAQCEVFLRQGDHVPQLSPAGTRHDSLFPEEAFRRQGFADYSDETVGNGI